MKDLAIFVLIFCVGGCIVVVYASKEQKNYNININRQYVDTPLYYKKYMKESIVYKNYHKH